MNRIHHWLCRSNHWRTTLQKRVPWVIENIALGPNVLEVGPGPGLTTDLLRESLMRLTVLELDPKLANALALRLHATNVRVVEGDATDMPFRDSEFSGAVSFTMLHHIPSPELQDQFLREVFRVLEPGGFFAGSDSLTNWAMKIIHIGDTFVPVNPDTFGARLNQAGFEVLEIQRKPDAFRFRAQRPRLPI